MNVPGAPESAEAHTPSGDAGPRAPNRVREWTFRLLLLGVSTLTSLLLGEALGRLWLGVPLLPLRPGLSVPDLYVPSDLLGYELRPGFRGRAFGASCEIDSRGLRATPEGDPELPEVAIVGDSSPFGFGVSQEETVGSHLARALRGTYRVRNYAVPGYTTRQYVDRFLRDAPPPGHPLAAVFCFLDQNDAGDEYGLVRQVGIPYLHSGPPRSPLVVLAKGLALDNSYVLCTLRSRLGGRLAPPPGGKSPAPQENPAPEEPRATPLPEPILESLERLREETVRRGAHLWVLPLRGRFEQGFHDGLEAFSQRCGTRVLTLLEEEEYHHLPWDPHPSPRAHRSMAEKLLRELGGGPAGPGEAPLAPPACR